MEKLFINPDKSEPKVDVDFGEIQGDMSLLLDNLDTPIKQGEYLVTETVLYERVFDMSPGDDIEQGWDTENTIKKQVLKAGDRVLVLWAKNIPVIIGLWPKGQEIGRLG